MIFRVWGGLVGRIGDQVHPCCANRRRGESRILTVVKTGVGALLISAGCLALTIGYRRLEGGSAHKVAVKPAVNQIPADFTPNAEAPASSMQLASLSVKSESTNSDKESFKDYKVTGKDNDWTIAKKAGISVKALHKLNPDINWNRLHPGQKVHIPGTESKPAAEKSSQAQSSHTSDTYYTVKGDDNDWTIAHTLGITVKCLHDLNPNIDWRRIHRGEKVHAPSGKVTVNYAGHVPDYVATAADSVVLHRGPSVDAARVTEVSLGTRAKVVQKQGDWYQLKFPKGTVAWVRSDMLVATSAERDSSSEDRPRSHRPASEQRYANLSRHGVVHGREEYAAAPPAKGTAGKVMRTAYAMRGTPYVWGGTSRSGGFDCSGFTSTVFKHDGIELPRTSREQSQVGKRVSINNLKKGDLIFFKTLGSRQINHVGIYIGNGKFIHASSGRGRVTVSSLSEGYYREHFAEARRIIKPSKSKKK